MESRDLVSWNAIIAGYAENGYWLRALDLFQELISASMFEPNSTTLVSILSACAHLKDLQVGKVIHEYILRHSCLYAITPVSNAFGHLNCMLMEGFRPDFITVLAIIQFCVHVSSRTEGGIDTFDSSRTEGGIDTSDSNRTEGDINTSDSNRTE
ncbi:hypothetical protein F3Y22_tig00110332pilonHSYRG00550 [Hibiscus syriacus]|uniref:Pentatricopeptide repeat-containing protein n=1 Tax=Hibiscus syriacus TaxID=106335 RepID=A0A6A3AVY3_HIBSY|nr:hypothetical protein F3Y22_tig00110332pilonHSYRG00550 [Hibiscus syriacus]